MIRNINTIFIVLFVVITFFLSCEKSKKTSNSIPPLELEFDNIAMLGINQQQLKLSKESDTEYPYKSFLDQDFNITLLRYYISDIKLEGPNGESFEVPVKVTPDKVEGIYLIDESKLSTGKIKIFGVPKGEYNKISFTLGIEEKYVQEGAAAGVLDPSTSNMFWNWNAGYIFFKFEGQSPFSNGGVTAAETIDRENPEGISLHIGGWRNIPETAFVNNIKKIELKFDTLAPVFEGSRPNIHIVFDVMSVFKAKHLIDFSVVNSIHKPSTGAQIADNVAAAFKYDHIEIMK